MFNLWGEMDHKINLR